MLEGTSSVVSPNFMLSSSMSLLSLPYAVHDHPLLFEQSSIKHGQKIEMEQGFDPSQTEKKP